MGVTEATGGTGTLVVFDVFGTLLREKAPKPAVDELLAETRRRLELSEEEFGRLLAAVAEISPSMSGPVQMATRELLRTLCEKAGVPYDEERLDGLLWHLLGDRDYRAATGSAALLKQLAADGHTLRVLSNCLLPGDLMRRALEGAGVPDVFDRTFFSADGGPRKPSPAAFVRAGEGRFARRIMVGDSEEFDLVPARALGWATVRVSPDSDWSVEVAEPIRTHLGGAA